MRAEEMRDVIEDFTRAKFAFLVDSKEFRRVKVTRTAWFTQFTYKHKSKGAAFEMILEFYDQNLTERLTNLSLDQTATHEADQLPSQRVAISFVSAARDILHVPDHELAQYETLIKSKLPWDGETYMAIIGSISDIVRSHVLELMEQPFDVIFAFRPLPHN